MAKANIPYLNSEGQLVKKCSKCGEEFFPTEEFFYLDNRRKLGSICKICYNKAIKDRRKGNGIEKHRQYQRKWKVKDRLKDPDKHKKYGKDYRDRHKDEISSRRKERYALPESEGLREKNRIRLKASSEKYNNNRNKKRKSNPEKYREAQRKWWAENDTPQRRMRSTMSGMIWQSLKGNKNGRHWESLVGYTLEDLKKHLEKQFRPGMTWDNYGKFGWHIDHRLPVSAFNFKTAEDIDFKRAWALSNLQPLWWRENLSKNNKLDKPFQPSLAFGGEHQSEANG